MNIHANPRAVIGGNSPPAPIADTKIDGARNCWRMLSAFLGQTPAIENADSAKEAANFLEQARRTLGDLEDERDGLVRPLNTKVREINDQYRKPREHIEALKTELAKRLSIYAAAEEAKRAAEAEAAWQAVGTQESDEDLAAAERTAARAERDIPVRLASEFGRTLSMRVKEDLVVDNAVAAIKALCAKGVPEKLEAAILSAARAYRKQHGRLPAGVSSHSERTF